MAYRLAGDAQVRKESWGLLFYQQTDHKVVFIKSGDWLQPEHFNGTWTLDSLIEDISKRTGSPTENIKRALPKLTDRLAANRMLLYEVR